MAGGRWQGLGSVYEGGSRIYEVERIGNARGAGWGKDSWCPDLGVSYVLNPPSLLVSCLRVRLLASAASQLPAGPDFTGSRNG